MINFLIFLSLVDCDGFAHVTSCSLSITVRCDAGLSIGLQSGFLTVSSIVISLAFSSTKDIVQKKRQVRSKRDRISLETSKDFQDT